MLTPIFKKTLWSKEQECFVEIEWSPKRECEVCRGEGKGWQEVPTGPGFTAFEHTICKSCSSIIEDMSLRVK